MAKDYDKIPSKVRGVKIHDFRANYRGNRYQFIVRDKKAKKDQAFRFESLKEGYEWAERQLSLFTVDLARAGRVTLAQVLPDYLAMLRASNFGRPYAIAVERLMNLAIEKGVRNLKDDAGCSRVINNMLSERMASETDPISATTARHYGVCFRTLGNWLVEQGPDFPKNPFRKVVLIEIPALEMPTFTPMEMHLLLTKGMAYKYADFLAGLAYSGQRCVEHAWLRWPQVLWDEKRLRVTLADDTDDAEAEGLVRRLLTIKANSKKDREANLRERLRKAVKGDKERRSLLVSEFIEQLRPLAKAEGYVYGDWARRATSCSHNDHLLKWCEEAGVEKRDRTIHSLRSTNSATLLAAGFDSLRLKTHLGHEGLLMTDHYSKAGDGYAELCSSWNGQLFWRTDPRFGQVSDKCLTTTDGKGQDGQGSDSTPPTTANKDPDEDEEIIIIVPDTSDIYRSALRGEGGKLRGNLSAPGILPVKNAGYADATLASSQVAESSSDEEIGDIGCPS